MSKASPFKALTITFLAVALLAGCGQRPQYKKVSLVPDGEVGPQPIIANGKLPLRVAIAAVISPRGTVQSYQPLLDYLGEKTSRPVELIQRQTYAEINDLIENGSVDLAFVCTGAYVVGQRDFGMELLVAPQVKGRTVYYSYIIVPADSRAESLDDLRGQVFAFSDPMSNTGYLALTYMLQQRGETPDSFFKKFIFTYSHDNSIKAVAEKLVGGAAVDSLVYHFTVEREPEYGQKTRVIEASPPYGIPPVVVHPALNPDLKAQLRSILLHMHEDKRGQEALREVDIDRFVSIDDSAYDSAREVVDAVGGQ